MLSGMRPDTHGRIAERARHQLGLVTASQLHDIGVTRKERRTMVATGRFERRGRYVLADTSAPCTEHQRLLAAVLDVRGSVVTGPTAAWLVGVRGFGPRPIHVLVKRGTHHRPVGSVLHETFWLPEHHRQIVDGVPCVSDTRLPFELAPSVHPERLRRIVDWLDSSRGLKPEKLAHTVAELCRSGRPGSAEMRLVADERLPGYVPPASELEAVFRDLCDEAGVQQGIRQLNAGGATWVGRVDIAFPVAKLLVELDSRRWHDTSTAFEDDRRRSNELVLAGWRVVRITWRMLHDEPQKVIAMLRRLLADAG
jgi:hypothetical protein